MSIRYLLIPLFLILLVMTIATNTSDTLYLLFMDWIEGKPSGLVRLHIVLPEKGSCYILCINYTDAVADILFSRIYYVNPTITFKVWRIPKRVEYINGSKVVRYFEHVFYFFVRTRRNIYVGLAIVEPKKPITDFNVKLHFLTQTDEVSLNNANSYKMGTTYNYQNVRIGEYHSINGIHVSWGFTSGDEYKKIRIELYHRLASIAGEDYLAYRRGEYNLNNLPWGPPSSPIKYPTSISVTGWTAAVFNGICAKVMGRVEYKYDMYCTEYPDDLTADFLLVMTPINLIGYWKDGTLSCNKCGKKPSASYGKIESGVKTGNVALGPGGGYKRWDTDLSFSIGISISKPTQYAGTSVTIGFSFTYRVSGSNVYSEARPKIHIVKDSGYVNKDLYYFFEGSPTVRSEVLHFTWIPP